MYKYSSFLRAAKRAQAARVQGVQTQLEVLAVWLKEAHVHAMCVLRIMDEGMGQDGAAH